MYPLFKPLFPSHLSSLGLHPDPGPTRMPRRALGCLRSRCATRWWVARPSTALARRFDLPRLAEAVGGGRCIFFRPRRRHPRPRRRHLILGRRNGLKQLVTGGVFLPPPPSLPPLPPPSPTRHHQVAYASPHKSLSSLTGGDGDACRPYVERQRRGELPPGGRRCLAQGARTRCERPRARPRPHGHSDAWSGSRGRVALGRRGAEGPREARAPHGASHGVAAAAPSWVTTTLLTSLAGVLASSPRHYEWYMVDVR